MRSERFEEHTTELFQACRNILNEKGPDYSGFTDRLKNFKEVARDAGITPVQALWTYFIKHVQATNKFVKGETLTGEPVSEKIKDMINYLVLLSALIQEEGEDTVANGVAPSFENYKVRGIAKCSNPKCPECYPSSGPARVTTDNPQVEPRPEYPFGE